MGHHESGMDGCLLAVQGEVWYLQVGQFLARWPIFRCRRVRSSGVPLEQFAGFGVSDGRRHHEYC